MQHVVQHGHQLAIRGGAEPQALLGTRTVPLVNINVRGHGYRPASRAESRQPRVGHGKSLDPNPEPTKGEMISIDSSGMPSICAATLWWFTTPVVSIQRQLAFVPHGDRAVHLHGIVRFTGVMYVASSCTAACCNAAAASPARIAPAAAYAA